MSLKACMILLLALLLGALLMYEYGVVGAMVGP
ncbi:UNVERIFIED_ORG: hypothetical protein M2414_005430 [Rahnella aquatilis]